MEFKAVIKSVGSRAFDDHTYILFDENISSDIANVSIQQEFENQDTISQFDIKSGDSLEINGHAFEVTHVGRLVNDNMRDIAHAVLLFGPVEGEPMENTIYLNGNQNQDALFEAGSHIIYNLK